ncbi:MAG: OmpA family protein [Bacteroidia bacterium]|nr:OmpA family protein [Bacteroidia bacterium]
MKKLFTTILTFYCFTIGTSQEIFIEPGVNFTSYKYKDVYNNVNTNVKNSSGLSFRVGLHNFSLLNQKFNYGISLQQFNATGGNKTDNYDWKTFYAGGFLEHNFSLINNIIYLRTAMELLFLIEGKQKIGGNTYNLKSDKEMSGFWINPSIGIKSPIVKSPIGSFDFGYNLSYAFKPGDQGFEKLYYLSNQLYLRFNIGNQKQLKLVEIKQKDAVAETKNTDSTLGDKEKDINNTTFVSIQQPKEVVPEVTIFFDINSYSIDKNQYQKLENLASFLNKNPTYIIKIIGFADEVTGKKSYNEKLSKKRAEKVLEFLVSKDVILSRCYIEGKGQTSEFNKQLYDTNRRVEILIIKQ